MYKEKYIPLLTGIGVRELSMDPHYIPSIQQAISQINLADAQAVAENMLARSRISDLVQTLNR